MNIKKFITSEKMIEAGEDSITMDTLLKENDRYDIKNPLHAVAEDMHCQFVEASESARFRYVPTVEDLVSILGYREPYEIKSCSDTSPEITISLCYTQDNPYPDLVIEEPCCTVTCRYLVQDIPSDRVGYLAVENFLNPFRYIPSMQRFYHEPYATQEEADAALEEMKLHEKYDSVKEMHVIDLGEAADNVWYSSNSERLGNPFLLEHPLANEMPANCRDAVTLTEDGPEFGPLA